VLPTALLFLRHVTDGVPITSRMAGIAIEARRIAANVAKLSVLVRCLLLAQSGRVDRAGKRSA
jgi:hypothetical protein